MKISGSKAVSKILAGAFLCGGILAVPSASGAMALIYELDHRFSGATLPGNNAPWAVATFLQVSETSVQLHLKANDIGSGYLNNWWFNFNGSLPSLQVTAIGETPGTSAPIFSYAANNATLFNTGRDSIRWSFSLFSGGSADFNSGDEIYLNFYSSSGLDIHQFDASIGAGGGPNLYSGANINGIPGTEKIVDLAPRYENINPPPPNFSMVPEASSMFLGFLLLAGCVGGEIVRRNRASTPATVPATGS